VYSFEFFVCLKTEVNCHYIEQHHESTKSQKKIRPFGMHLALHYCESKSIYKHETIKNTEYKIEQKLAEVLTPDRTIENNTANQITDTLHYAKKKHLYY
jgi:hypothetical protein